VFAKAPVLTQLLLRLVAYVQRSEKKVSFKLKSPNPIGAFVMSQRLISSPRRFPRKVKYLMHFTVFKQQDIYLSESLSWAMFEGYEIGLDEIYDWIKKNNFSSVGIQMPEGLKRNHAVLAKLIEKETGVAVAFSGEPCYGACDLVDADFESMGIEALVHIGHTDIGDSYRIPVYFTRLKSTVNVKEVIEKAVPKLEDPVGLVTTAQHVHKIEEMFSILGELGFDAKAGKGPGKLALGEVLGCGLGAATSIADNVRSYLFVGSGTFHPLGIAMNTSLRVVAADPYTGEVQTLDEMKDRILRIRFAAIEKAREEKEFCVLVALKSGQRRKAIADKCKTMLQASGRGATIVILRNVSPEGLAGLVAGAFVSTACPRVAIDDAARFDRPILTPPELEIMLGERSWEDYRFDQLR
jgi:2-(3-amino-3-carboxypropyl)histidine synthase